MMGHGGRAILAAFPPLAQTPTAPAKTGRSILLYGQGHPPVRIGRGIRPRTGFCISYGQGRDTAPGAGTLDTPGVWASAICILY